MECAGRLIDDRDDAEPSASPIRDTRCALPTPAFGTSEPLTPAVTPILPRPAFAAPQPAKPRPAPPLPQPAFATAPQPLPFRAVNTPDRPGYDPGFQRHHLLPRQLLSARCFGPMMEGIGRNRVGFDDFRSNGLLLPATDSAAVRIGLPMHRGPHRDYNALVIERVGQIEESWSRQRLRTPDRATDEAVMRMGVLQKALRRRLLQPASAPLRLNRFDPAGRVVDLAALDSLVDDLWPATEPVPALPNPGFGQPAQPAAEDPSNLALAC